MLTFEHLGDKPFTFRVHGDPEPDDPLVVVICTRPIRRRRGGPIALSLETYDPHTCPKSEAEFLITHGVAQLPPRNEAA